MDGGACLMIHFNLNHTCKSFISKYSHILNNWGLGLQHMNFGRHNSAHVLIMCLVWVTDIMVPTVYWNSARNSSDPCFGLWWCSGSSSPANSELALDILSPKPCTKPLCSLWSIGSPHVSHWQWCHRVGWGEVHSQFINEEKILRCCSFPLTAGSCHTLNERPSFSCVATVNLAVWEGGSPYDTLLPSLRKTGHSLQLDKNGQLMSLWVLTW